MSEPERRLAVRTLAAAAGLLLGAWVCARACIRALQRLAPVAYAKATYDQGRLHEISASLPAIAARPEPTAVFLGSSCLLFDFSPVAFDDELRRLGVPLTSFDFSMPIFDAVAEELLAARVAGQAGPRRFRLAALEFDPQDSTFAFGRLPAMTGAVPLRRAFLSDWSALGRLAASSPGDALSLAGLKALGGLGPGQGENIATIALFPAKDGGFQKKLAAAFGGRTPRWNAARRGEWRLDFPQTHALYLAYSSQYSTRESFAAQLENWGGEQAYADMRIDDAQVRHFIEAVRRLRPVSDRLVVLVCPRHPWTPESAEGSRRVQEALSLIGRETGAPILDLRREFPPGAFRDVAHLDEEAQAELSRRLARRLAPALRGAAQAVAR